MPPSPRLPSPLEAKIIACVNGRSLNGASIVREAPVSRDGVYMFLGRLVDVGFITRVGLEYRATVLGIAALRRKEQIDALRAAPLDLEKGGDVTELAEPESGSGGHCGECGEPEADCECTCGYCRRVGACCICDERSDDDA